MEGHRLNQRCWDSPEAENIGAELGVISTKGFPLQLAQRVTAFNCRLGQFLVLGREIVGEDEFAYVVQNSSHISLSPNRFVLGLVSRQFSRQVSNLEAMGDQLFR